MMLDSRVGIGAETAVNRFLVPLQVRSTACTHHVIKKHAINRRFHLTQIFTDYFLTERL